MLGTKVSQFIKKRYTVQPQRYSQQAVFEKELEPEHSPFVPAINAERDLPEQTELVMEPTPDPVIEQDPVLNEYDHSKLGRTYGWWVCINGERVASLEYCCLLEDLVHLYSVNVLDDQFLLIDLDATKWLGPNVTIQSRYAESYIRPGLNMAAVGQNMIVAENLFIPEEHFRRRHHEMEEFHHKLVNKAKSKTRA